MPQRTKNAVQLRKYLNELSNPKNEQSGLATFWSRTVRDNARALVDALTMEEEGVPPTLIQILTTSADRPNGYDMAEVHAALSEGESQ